MSFFLKKKSLEKIFDKLLENFKILMIINTSLLDLIKLLVFSFFIIHNVACFWYLITLFDVSNTWIIDKNLFDENIYVKYAYSLYWSTVTIMTVGYGDIVPKNNFELIFSTFTIFIGCVVFGYSINSIGNIVSDLNRERNIFK